MKKKSTFYLLPVMAICMIVAMLQTSCSDDDEMLNPEPSKSAQSFNYGLCEQRP